MKFFSLERFVWILAVLAIGLGTIMATNYVRDHEVYRQTASQCAGDKSALQQEIERRSAEIEKQGQEITQLKNLPLR
jgi:hypothetical protein